MLLSTGELKFGNMGDMMELMGYSGKEIRANILMKNSLHLAKSTKMFNSMTLLINREIFADGKIGESMILTVPPIAFTMPCI